ncbi:uroporphyrinogen-III synthase [Nitratireductor kimnyeongensis]|uniref:Uroporphyrinogen-III synthase n=1 Tax=Nitratireductor kimnyeongensis TaxID=430679 RepID=A0ABW0TA68_9HYPH|nr:uroporphyrinogen-III synthase [Nitratireductor kimnyeongensis]QZZ36609.1 uroporphyrinogen-III synthase [Nitratireductor kimnyeongensis]
MRRVLVTRPEPGASETAARLAGMGFEPLVLPLTETVPLHPAIHAQPVDVVAITSPNAIRHAPQSVFDALKGKPVLAVGRRTGEAARAAGLDVVDDEAGDAERLARCIDAAFMAPADVTVLCGRVRRDVLETRLRAAGHRPRLIEIYDTLPLEPSDAAIRSVIGEWPVDAVLLYSANGAEQLRRFMARSAMGTKLGAATFYCLSERIAGILGQDVKKTARIADFPSEDRLLFLLKT